MTNSKVPKAPDLSAAVVREEGEHYVVLPCAVSEFGSFVSGLLGKPQELKGHVEGSFDVEYQEIANVFHLVHTRVIEQNEGSLAHFSITVHYDNGTSITHNDVAKFKTYNPVDSCTPYEVVLNFTYLIKFPGKDVPEKQMIEVAIVADSDRSVNRERHYMDGAFEYKILYTNRTWATDIGSLLKNHGETIIEKTSKLKRKLRRYNDEILSLIVSVVMMLVIFSWATLAYNVSGSYSSVEEVTGKHIDELVRFFVGSISVLAMLGISLQYVKKLSEYHLYPPLESYIVLVDNDAKNRKKRKKKSLWKWVAIFSTWIFSIAAGLVANYLNHAGYFLPN